MGFGVKIFRFRKMAEIFVREKPQGIPFGQGHRSSEGMACFTSFAMTKKKAVGLSFIGVV